MGPPIQRQRYTETCRICMFFPISIWPVMKKSLIMPSRKDPGLCLKHTVLNLFLIMSFPFYCYVASKTGINYMWGEILETILVKNAPDILGIKSLAFKPSLCPHHFPMFTYGDPDVILWFYSKFILHNIVDSRKWLAHTGCTADKSIYNVNTKSSLWSISIEGKSKSAVKNTGV
jgi:hypothetical protein